jgi:hypothetical protein
MGKLRPENLGMEHPGQFYVSHILGRARHLGIPVRPLKGFPYISEFHPSFSMFAGCSKTL